VIGLQKLIDAALIVNPEAMYKILEEYKEAIEKKKSGENRRINNRK